MAGVAAVLAMGGFTAACSSEEGESPETSTTTTTTTAATTTVAPPVSPTENAPRIAPNAPNPFSPTVYAPPPDTATPGQHHGPRGQ